jgi:SCY1-like protein 1
MEVFYSHVRLGGLDYVCSLSEQSPILVEHGRYITLSNISIPPEIRSESWSGLKSIPSHAVDSWAFGCLIYEIYNQKPSKIEDLMIIGLIPSELVNYYKRFLSQSAKSRLSFKQFLETGKQYRGFFDDDFIKTTIFLEELQLKTDSEKESFIRYLLII